jgi:hypothetical protein
MREVGIGEAARIGKSGFDEAGFGHAGFGETLGDDCRRVSCLRCCSGGWSGTGYGPGRGGGSAIAWETVQARLHPADSLIDRIQIMLHLQRVQFEAGEGFGERISRVC